MAELRRVGDHHAATALARLLTGADRRTPVVVVSVPAGRAEPFIDAARIVDEVGDLARVYLLTTGPHTWTFSREMPELTQVYGGAGRVYPVGHEWVADPHRSPLRLAFNRAEGDRATEDLISDALRMATDAGLLRRTPTPAKRPVHGVVAGIPVPERAMVSVGRSLATVAEELTVPGVPLDRVLRVGLTVQGVLDDRTGRLDLIGSLLDPAAQLAAYALGEVVLAEVHQVEAGRARLRLHPRVTVEVSRAAVTSNDLDDLRSLMSPGEVVRARVTGLGPDWRLSLLDVDDDEVARPAPALLPDGPPWLVETEPGWLAEPASAEPEPAPQMPELLQPVAEPGLLVQPVAEPEVPVDTSEPVVPESTGPPRPTPLLLDRRRERGGSAPPVPPPAAETTNGAGPAVATLTRTVDGLKAELAQQRRVVAGLQEQLQGLVSERGLLEHVRDQQARDLARLEHELRTSRSRLRREVGRRGAAAPAPDVPEFADPEQGFRYAVLTAWARRTPPAEQASRPLGVYTLGPDFLTSLQKVDGISADKVADVVFEIVTGRARDLPGRELHQLRESDAGGAPSVRRADGAVCWRASLQVKSPQARRLHYWQLPGGEIELSRVTLHDDFQP
ncbi:MAG TPA: hypothetical protein PLP61_13050 [Nocardioides sp.]|uniref:hypothetical protein n=1 Tax=Nocardioides sp. TaxID=35761 RepID=UPI002CEA4359|nr:hypothetical protein [Nocardioides sp.]HQR27960.1 hypothetical protein [Nocardioides sp.]